MKKFILSLVVSMISVGSSFAETLVCYPNTDEAIFTVSIPDEGWEFTASEGYDVDGGYCTLQRENTTLYFRTIACSEDSILDAIQETIDYLAEEYGDLQIESPSELSIQGYDALASSSSGVDGDGYGWVFGFAWIFIDETHIAEIWYESTPDEVRNHRDANNILNTFTIVD